MDHGRIYCWVYYVSCDLRAIIIPECTAGTLKNRLLVSKYDGDFDLVQGRYRIDAKSIVGIFSLDLSKPVELYIEKESDALLRDLGRFLINDQDLRW